MGKLHFVTDHSNRASVKRDWYVVDASDKVVGRLASKIATILQGKNKPYYSPHVDCGDYLIVKNVDKVVLSGNKMKQKIYVRFSGYPGGKKEITAEDMMHRNPSYVMGAAIRGMLPKSRLGRQMFKKLFLYAGDTNSHATQKPKVLEL